MKAPDKIYLPVVEEDGKMLLCINWWKDNDISNRNEYVKGAIPYIRKDALLEWLEQNRNQSQMWFDRYHEKENLSAEQVWEEVIDKINSM